MRTVYLTPDHSSWWLLSPGITLYFDELRISRRDHQKLIERSGDSSYHEQLALHYERFSKSGATNIQIIDDSEVQSDAVNVGGQLAGELLNAAENNPEFIDPLDLLSLTRNSFLNWIQYNQRRLLYLREDEPMYALLTDELASWSSRLSRFDLLLCCRNVDIFTMFREDKELLSTFNRLVTSAARCVELADKGLRIYDPMLESYMPMIDVLERFVSAPTCSRGNALESLNAYSFRMSRYGETVPVSLGMDGLLRTIDEYSIVRRKLERIDEAFGSIRNADLTIAFAQAKQEIAPLVKEALDVSRATEYAFWGVGLRYDMLSWIAAPLVTDKLKSIASAFSLISKRVGKFAGSYALIAEQLISQQDLIKESNYSRRFDPSRYSSHFKNFIDRDVGDENAV